MSGPDFFDYRDETRALERIVAAWGFTVSTENPDGGPPHASRLHAVTHDYFDVLGVVPAVGREFLPEEDAPEGAHVVVLAHHKWSTRFGADPGVVGRTIDVAGDPHLVVGVMPETFRAPVPPESPMGLERPDLWRPLRYGRSTTPTCNVSTRAVTIPASTNGLPGTTTGSCAGNGAVAISRGPRKPAITAHTQNPFDGVGPPRAAFANVPAVPALCVAAPADRLGRASHPSSSLSCLAAAT